MDGSTVDTTEWLVSTSFFNSTQEADETATVDEYAQQVIQRFQYVNLAVRLAMGFVAFSTNLLTIVAIASFESLRSATKYLIAYLAFADMLSGINTIFLVTNYLTPMSHYAWTRMCALETSLSFISAGINVLAIFAISIDRFVFITFPLRYYIMPTDKAVVVFIAASVVLVIGQLMGLNCCGYNDLPDRICIGKVFNTGVVYVHYTFYTLSIMIIMINIRIAYIAYQQKKAIALGQMSEVSTDQNKITKMLSMVLGVYYFCYMPQMTVFIILGFYPGATYGVIIERVSSWFWWVNSWSNPPIYAWKNKAFNKAFRRLLGMKGATVDAASD